jgi:hypothetical protein
MTNRVFVTSQHTASFVCPKCQRAKIADVSKYANFNKRIKANVKCPCGHSFSTLLEKRKQYRKETDIPGSFVHYTDGKPADRGLMTVCDLSVTGIKLKVNSEYNFSVGDLLQNRFILDDPKKTVMNKKVIIRNIDLPFIGAEFPITEREDKALGFYMLK